MSYDQYSFVRMAFEEAYIPAVYRRRAERIKQKVNVELQPWDGTAPGSKFSACIIDYSATGFGIVYDRSIETGKTFILKLPRTEQPPLSLTLHAARCDQVEANEYEIGLQYDSLLDDQGRLIWGSGVLPIDPAVTRRLRKRSLTKVLFLAFGLAGITVGAFL